MSPDDLEPLRPEDGNREPLDPNELPAMVFERGDEDHPRSTAHTWWFVVAAATIVVVGMVVGIIVFNASAPRAPRGAESAKAAATTFVAAVNASNQKAATAISCDGFTDDARSAARSAGQGIDFTLDKVITSDRTSATAFITQRLTLPLGRRQTEPANLSVLRTSGRWLVCGFTS